AYGATHFSARTLNWLHAFFGLGTTIGPLIVTSVLGAGLDWRWSYLLVGSAQGLLAAVFWWSRAGWQRLPTHAAGGDAPRVRAARARDTLRLPPVWLGMLTYFFYTGMEVTTAQWTYSLLTIGRDVPATTAGLMVSLYWGSMMVGRVLFGIVADRVPMVATLRGCILASLVGALLLWLEPTRLLAFAGLMLLGLGHAPVFASLISLTPPRVGTAHADNAIGFQVAAAALGGATLTALAGLAARSAGLEVIGAAIVLFGVVLLGLYELLLGTGRRLVDGAGSGAA
ncbi:MAG: MFS transporter, partial [Dongiaceae bacterium]